jgi:hypothetical protein
VIFLCQYSRRAVDFIISHPACFHGQCDTTCHTSEAPTMPVLKNVETMIIFNYALKIDPMNIGSSQIDWYRNIKYLGVYVVAGKCLSFDKDSVKRAFYTACNYVFSQSGRMDDILQLTLQETYYLPIFIICFTCIFV